MPGRAAARSGFWARIRSPILASETTTAGSARSGRAMAASASRAKGENLDMVFGMRARADGGRGTWKNGDLTNDPKLANGDKRGRTTSHQGTPERNQCAIRSTAVFPNPETVLRAESHLRGAHLTKTPPKHRVGRSKESQSSSAPHVRSSRNDDGDREGRNRRRGAARQNHHDDPSGSRIPRHDDRLLRGQCPQRGRGRSARLPRKKPSTM